jgi:transposase
MINPELLTAAERLQYDGFVRREEANASILALSKEGVPLKQIAKRTGYSRQLVRQVVRGLRTDVFRTRESSLEVHLPWLDAQWDAGKRNAADLWRRLKHQGFKGSKLPIITWRDWRMGHTPPQG